MRIMKPKNRPILEPTALDWASLAAFIDGEGSVFIGVQKYKSRNTGKSYRRTYGAVDISNTDVRLFIWLKERFGGCISPIKSDNPKWKPAYHWRRTDNDAVFILKNCLEYFVIKRSQAEIVIAHQKLRAKLTGVRIDENLLNERLKLRDQLSMLKNPTSRRKDLRELPTIQ